MLSPSDDGSDKAQPGIHVLEILANAIVGGMENYVRNLVRLLPEDRFRVTCLFPYESAMTTTFRNMGCDVYVARMDDDPPWRSIQAAVEIVRNHHVDLIHANLPKAHVLGGLAGALTRTPVVATVHGMTISTHELGIARTTNTNLVVVCQEAYIQALAMGLPEERVTLIHNGVDPRAFRPSGDGDAFREALGLPPDVPLVGMVGRLEHEKGPDHFVQMARYVLSLRPATHLVLVGTGSMQDDLARMIEEMGLAGRVHLAGFWADTSQVYPALDIVALTSRMEGTPLTVLEAMACGRPVVATSVGGILDAVEMGSTGLLAGPGDWQGVGERVIDLLDHEDRRRQMGEAARKRAEKQFNLRDTVRHTAELFDKLVSTRAGSRSRWPQNRPGRLVAR